jgi:NTE family protein
MRCTRRPDGYFQRSVLALLLALLAAACAPRAWNEPLGAVTSAPAYSLIEKLPQKNSRKIFTILAFSGGGMRSAAFSYGTLKALQETEVVIKGEKRPLLGEVDVITAVSGGSYTAAYYGLFGERIFLDYEEKFLRKNIENRFLLSLADPANLSGILSEDFNRSDVSALWLSENIFAGKTFSDMSVGELPFVIINASDINNGLPFPFVQQQFDFICSDINAFPVANAVMASSAVPALFAPITLKSFSQDCSAPHGGWIEQALSQGAGAENYDVARKIARYVDGRPMPFLRLLDGGITDNLGLRGSIMSPVTHYGDVAAMAGAFTKEDLDEVTDVLVLVANAQVYPDYPWSQEGSDPGIYSMLMSSFDAALDLLNTETIQQAKRRFDRWADLVNRRRAPRQAKVRVHFVDLTFDGIENRQAREYFNSIPTALVMEPRALERVIELPKQLLNDSFDFQRFVYMVNEGIGRLE